MSTNWDPLLDSLRNELQEYGALLNLFGQQQNAILGRAPDLVLEVTNMISAQVSIIDRFRLERESLVKGLAAEQRQPCEAPLSDLLPFFPEAVRPLMQALIDEINNLITRTRRRARQNQMLLSRSIEVTQQILARLNPEGMIKTYSPSGRVQLKYSESGSRKLTGSI